MKKSRWLFPSETGKFHIRGESIDKTVRRSDKVFKKVKIKHFTPHDLRRTAATYMTEMGIPRLNCNMLLNHIEDNIVNIKKAA